MKTFLTPSLIAIACFSGFTVAETSLSAQHNNDTQFQLSVKPAANANSNASVDLSVNQQSRLHAGASEEQAVLDSSANADNRTQTDLQLAAEHEPAAADEMTIAMLALTDIAGQLSNSMADVNAAEFAMGTVIAAQQTGNSATALAINLAQEVNTNIAANANQAADVASTVQQQVQGNVNQAVQQDAAANVAQSVNRAVNAEVANSVRNSIGLRTSL